jgi:periplasmic copper chaperone A
VTPSAPLRAALLLVVGFPAAAHAQSAAPASAAATTLSVADAWVRVIPGAAVAAAYMTLRNSGAKPVVVVGAHSPLAGAAMLHESKLVDGQEQMRPLERLEIPAGGVVQLKPGGIHLMLHMLSRTPVTGAEVPIVLELEGGGTLAVSAHVRPLGAD